MRGKIPPAPPAADGKLGRMSDASMLVAIKLLHTAVWAFFVSCILGIPVCALRRRQRAAGWLSLLVLLEVAVLAVNGGHCPLTDVAARYTSSGTMARPANFDIYLPEWLARHNKLIFGGLWLIGEAVYGWAWWRRKPSAEPACGRGAAST